MTKISSLHGLYFHFQYHVFIVTLNLFRFSTSIFFFFVLIARWSLFGSGDQIDFWEIICRFAHPASIASVHDMEEIQSDIGRVSDSQNWT